MGKRIIIVPDVHGRTFWKEVKNYDCDIVFLGDYLDPYSYKVISRMDALNNFYAILEFAQSRSNVHLLLGEHDLQYAIGKQICDLRCDNKTYRIIHDLFVDYAYMFKLAYDCFIYNKTFLFTHAGVTKPWCQLHEDDFGCTFLDMLHANCLNNLYDRMSWSFKRALGEVSRERGGSNKYGSVVWADFREHLYPREKSYPDVCQIIGHTAVSKPINIYNNYHVRLVDTGSNYYLDEYGSLRTLDTDKLIEDYHQGSAILPCIDEYDSIF